MKRKVKKKHRSTEKSPFDEFMTALKILVHAICRVLDALFTPIGNYLKPYIVKISKAATPQMIYWVLGLLVFFLPLLVSTWRIITGPITTEREQWDSAFRQFSKPIIVHDEPMRGNIYAADGRPVAVAGESYRLYLDFRHPAISEIYCDTFQMPRDSVKISRRKQKLEKLHWQMDLAAQRLAEFYHIDMRADRKRWEEERIRRSSNALLLDRDITYPEWYKLKQVYPFSSLRNPQKTNKIDTTTLFGILITNPRNDLKYVRINPFDSLARRTIGALYKEKQPGTQAKYGVELGLDSLLIGKPGISHRLKIADSRANRIIDSVQHGLDVYTTIDMDKQYLVEQTLNEQLVHLGAESGTCVLMEVKTGKMLAVVNLARGADGIYREDRNLAFSDMSEPGSTIKIASMLVALNDGVVRPDDIVDVGNGRWLLYGTPFSDYNADRGGFGQITASQVVERSSNVGIAKIIYANYSNRQEEFIQKMNNLGFGMDLRSDIPGAARAIIPSPYIETMKNGVVVRKKNKEWSEVSIASVSYGYATKIPPIYTLAFFNAIANDGKFMRPYIITDIKKKDGRLVKHIEPEVLKEQIASPEAIAAIREMMHRVVSERGGTGKGMRSDIVSIAGKSGTAWLHQSSETGYRGKDGRREYLVSFCAYFPSEAPKYSIIMVARKPKGAPAGGAMAAPVIKAIAERLVSMETPRELNFESLQTPSLSTKLPGGRKDAITRLAGQTHLPHSFDNSIKMRDYIFLDANGQERPVKTVATGQVPYLVGLTATDAAAYLARLGYRAKFRGYGIVVKQSVAPGTALKSGAIVQLTLGRQV